MDSSPLARYTYSRSSKSSNVIARGPHGGKQHVHRQRSYERDLDLRVPISLHSHSEEGRHEYIYQHRQREAGRSTQQRQFREHGIVPRHDYVDRHVSYSSRRVGTDSQRVSPRSLHQGWQKKEYHFRHPYKRRHGDRVRYSPPRNVKPDREIKHFNDGYLMPDQAGVGLRNQNGKLPAREDLQALAARSHVLA